MVGFQHTASYQLASTWLDSTQFWLFSVEYQLNMGAVIIPRFAKTSAPCPWTTAVALKRAAAARYDYLMEKT